MEEKEILEKRFDDLSREQLIAEIKNLEKNLDIGRSQFFRLEDRINDANHEIDFLRQVILNLTKK